MIPLFNNQRLWLIVCLLPILSLGFKSVTRPVQKLLVDIPGNNFLCIRKGNVFRQMVAATPSSKQGTTNKFINNDQNDLGYEAFSNYLTAAFNGNQIQKFTKLIKRAAVNNHANIDYSPVVLPLLSQLLDKLDATDIANCLWSLPKIGFKVIVPDHKRLCMALLHQLCEKDELTPREVTTGLGGLSKIHLKWDDLTPQNQEDIFMSLDAVSSKLNDREIGNILHSLSKIQMPWIKCPKSVQNGLLQSFVFHSKRLIAQQGAMSIYSFGLMGVELEELTPALRDCLFLVAMNVLKDTESIDTSISQQISNVIYGIAKLGVKKGKSLPPAVFEAVLHGVRNVMGKHMNEQEVSNTIYSFGIMGIRWNELPSDIIQLFEISISQRIRKMITQGVSNSLYGMGLMGAEWDFMSEEYRNAVTDACIASFGPKARQLQLQRRHRIAPQAIANVIYSLGSSNVKWTSLKTEMVEALSMGIEDASSTMNSQELSITTYGLGIMRAEFILLNKTLIVALILNFNRMMTNMNQQELCSTLHGYAKMGLQWNTAPEYLTKTIISAIIQKADLEELCLACSVYSLGQMGASWDSLPNEIRYVFTKSSKDGVLFDQTMSNLVYGLSTLNAQWATIEPEFRDTIVRNLANPMVFSQDVPQHISNTLYGLGKMDALWELLPIEQLTNAMIRCKNTLGSQEISNIIYGIAIMDSSWKEISDEGREAIMDTILSKEDTMARQEIANVMYSLALLTFDYPINKKTDKLWKLHKSLLRMFKRIRYEVYDQENYDQFGMYFAFLNSLPGGPELIQEVFHENVQVSGPAPNIPSRLHAKAVHAMLQNLHYHSKQYSIMNEFSGLNGIFPVDAAVFLNDELVAFVEIDGEFHYKQIGQKLKRKDKLKEHLYYKKYPKIPIFRIRSDQCSAIGIERSGQELANWITAAINNR
eukprot:gene11850-24840_t